MKPLPDKWKRCGHSWQVVRREGDVVMVQLVGTDCYEVAIVQRHNGRTFADGTTSPPAEYMPGNSDFGRLGWYYCDKARAKAMFAELVEKAALPKRGRYSRQPVSGASPTPQIA